MFILDVVGRTGGVSGPGGPQQRPNVTREREERMFNSLQQMVGSTIPFANNQIQQYRPINDVFNALLGTVESRQLVNPQPDRMDPNLRRDRLRAAWNGVQDMARAGNRRPLEILTGVGINEEIINNPATLLNLPRATQAHMDVMHGLTQEFQTNWENIHTTAVNGSRELLELNRSSQNLSSR